MGKFEIEDNVFPEFFGGWGGGGANMVYYGRCGNGKQEKIRNPGENTAQ